MCNCPEPLPPPNPQVQKCRLILQVLAVGLLAIIIFAIVVGDIMSIFMYLLLVYMLFMSWSQFNWCFTLVFFLFSVADFIQVTILLVGMIQYQKLFAQKFITLSVYLLLSFFYFSAAIYFSHYAYRHFKATSQSGVMDMGIVPGANPNPPNAGNYQRLPEPAPQNNAFQGQGVRIG